MKMLDFSGGLNTLQPAEKIADNEFSELQNVCYDEGNILRSRYGFSLHRAVSNVRKMYPFYVGGAFHIIYTASGGLYDNGTLLDSSFTGLFIADEYASMIYLTNGTYFKRYDGSTLYNVGVAAPAVPTVTVEAYDTRTIDDFETNPVAYTNATRETGAGNIYEGTSSIKITVSPGSSRTSIRTFATAFDLTKFDVADTTNTSSYTDFISFYIKASSLSDISSITIRFQDASYRFRAYIAIIPGEEYDSETIKRSGLQASLPGSQESAKVMYLPRDAENFVNVKIYKGDFWALDAAGQVTDQFGDDKWTDIKLIAFRIGCSSEATADVDVYIDQLELVGASGENEGLVGRYAFCAGYYNTSRHEYFEVSEETGYLNTQANNLLVSGVPATFPDTQVNRYIVWARRETSQEWRQLVSVSEGTTSVVVNESHESLITKAALTEQAGIFPLPRILASGEIKTRDSTNNTPPPVGSYIRFHRGKLFILDGKDVYHSKSGQPWAVPVDFHLEAASDSDPFQAMYSDGGTLTLHTKARDFSYINPGEYDGNFFYMGYIAPAKNTLGCVAPHSVAMGLFASGKGIAQFDGSGHTILTNRVNPTYLAISNKTALHAVVYDSFYLLVNPAGNALVIEQHGDSVRFFEWTLPSTPRCCMVDVQTNTLYIGTDAGIYFYNKSKSSDASGSFTMVAESKNLEYGTDNEDLPLERFMVDMNPGGNVTEVSFLVDGVSHGSVEMSGTARIEQEGFFDLGAVGSFLKVRLEATVSAGQPVRLYALEAT